MSLDFGCLGLSFHRDAVARESADVSTNFVTPVSSDFGCLATPLHRCLLISGVWPLRYTAPPPGPVDPPLEPSALDQRFLSPSRGLSVVVAQLVFLTTINPFPISSFYKCLIFLRRRSLARSIDLAFLQSETALTSAHWDKRELGTHRNCRLFLRQSLPLCFHSTSCFLQSTRRKKNLCAFYFQLQREIYRAVLESTQNDPWTDRTLPALANVLIQCGLWLDAER